jgi:hypothetical protein
MRSRMIRPLATALALLVAGFVGNPLSPAPANAAAPGGPLGQVREDLDKVINALCGGNVDTCQAGAGVTGLQRVQADSPFNFVATKQVDADCPTGKKVVGGGYLFFFGGPTVPIRTNAPTLDLGSWRVSGTNLDGSDWSVSAIAICADAAD